MSALTEKIDTLTKDLETLVEQTNEAQRVATAGREQALVLSGKLQGLREFGQETGEIPVEPPVSETEVVQ
jgi:small-conductance mechanosensitive channel